MTSALVGLAMLGLLSALTTHPEVVQPNPQGSRGGDVEPGAHDMAWGEGPEGVEIIVVRRARAATRILRGDWEPPDVLLLTYTEDWAEALAAIISAAAQEAHVVLVIDQDGDATLLDNPPDSLPTGGQCGSFTVVRLDHDTPWVRDYGPLQITDVEGRATWLDFFYGPQRRLDDRMPVQLSRQWDVDVNVEQYSLSLDGGALISNGRGLCAMTDRNLTALGLDASYEGGVWDGSGDQSPSEAFLFTVGCRALVVLPALEGEATGHADIFAQFLGPDVVAVATVSGQDSAELAVALEESAHRMERGARRLGQPMRVVRVPMHVDASVFYTFINGTRLSSSFLVPSYAGVPAVVQAQAYQILRLAMPGVTLVPIPADAMIEHGGAIHCMTVGLSLGRSPERIVRSPSSLAGRAWKGRHRGRRRL